MASPVDTSVKHMLSSMTGAPALDGTAGSLLGVLDAFLVDGWGSQTASSVVIADGVATVTLPSAPAATVDSVILVAGATPSGLNGEQKVTGVGPGNVLTFDTEESDGSATGTITVKMAPCGWSKVYSGTNKAVYRSNDVQAHGGGMYLRVDDSSTTTPRVVGYESMSDVDTGTGPFPTSTQLSGGGYWYKSGAGATVRGYALFGDSRTFYIAFNPGYPTYNTHVLRGFGDGISRRPTGDAYAVFLCANNSSGNDVSGALDRGDGSYTWTPRPYIGLGTAEAGRSLPFVGGSGMSGAENILGSFPNPVDGSLILSKRYWSTNTNQPPRFDFPGILSVPQSGLAAAFGSVSTVPGTGDLAGRTLMVVPSGNNPGAAATGGFVVDVTGPWR
jgi:hypothetical protein